MAANSTERGAACLTRLSPVVWRFPHASLKGWAGGNQSCQQIHEMAQSEISTQQGSCAADLYRHPQLDADIEAVKEIYGENSVSVSRLARVERWREEQR
ncbi:hypothetical protein scyTo_0001899 [Scyliorhinus torazame]|uniref:Uncharacterized protein n=1 Tax=Scyliorhinus torazame TaxID=75743 RepID=A0A401PGK9_SCYTO|nr:hypothetical protein [Scyliorhinus torazame]